MKFKRNQNCITPWDIQPSSLKLSVRGSTFGYKTLGKCFFLMFSPSTFDIFKKVTLSVQISKTLDNLDLSFFTWNFLIIFKIFWVICDSTNSKCFFEHCHLDIFHFQVFTNLNIHSFLPNLFISFFQEKSKQPLEFVTCFNFCFKFFKSIRVLSNFICNIY